MTAIETVGEEKMDAGAFYSNEELEKGHQAYIEDWEQSCSQPLPTQPKKKEGDYKEIE